MSITTQPPARSGSSMPEARFVSTACPTIRATAAAAVEPSGKSPSSWIHRELTNRNAALLNVHHSEHAKCDPQRTSDTKAGWRKRRSDLVVRGVTEKTLPAAGLTRWWCHMGCCKKQGALSRTVRCDHDADCSAAVFVLRHAAAVMVASSILFLDAAA